MEKTTRKFEKQYTFNKRNFKLQIELNETDGMFDLWMYEDLDIPFVFSITNDCVHRDELFDNISTMEDRTHEHALKNDLDLVLSAMMDKGFYEMFESSKNDIVETEIARMEG